MDWNEEKIEASDLTIPDFIRLSYGKDLSAEEHPPEAVPDDEHIGVSIPRMQVKSQMC